jgi:starch phosphorylase
MIQRLNEDFCRDIRQKYPNDEARIKRMSIIEEGQVKMAHLSIYASRRVNGVAALHTDILKQDIFRDFAEMYPDKIVNVTNGVTQRRWIFNCNPRLSEFIIKRIGRGWITNLQEIEQLSQYASDTTSQEEFLAIKRANKKDFIDFLKEHNPFRDSQGKTIGYPELLDESALFDVQIKRLHEYKRQLMTVLHTLILYNELAENSDARKIKRMVIIGGKSAPGYSLMKHLIRLISCVTRKIDSHPSVGTKLRLVFLENYNASRAEKIVPAADLSEQVSCAGMEASGTGNMKMAMNGALTIGTDDGANIEMHANVTDQWWPFGFGRSAEENRALHESGSYNPRAIYDANTKIKQAVDMLVDGSLAQTPEEQEALRALHHTLLDSDNYFVLGDMESYMEAQRKVEALYLEPNKWAEYALQNIAHMKRFSTDESIRNYANIVWGLLPEPVDPEELAQVRLQYSQHDKCRIF